MDFGKNLLLSAVKDHPESETAKILYDNFNHFEQIYKVLDGKWEKGWGSYMFNGIDYKWQRETLKKQEALFNIAKNNDVKNVLEIGVYIGHSLLILLLANPNLKITCIDNDTRFSPKVVSYLNKVFDNRILFIQGNAQEILPVLSRLEQTYDIIHIDADHTNEAVTQYYNLSKPLAKQNSYIVFDDYEATRCLIDSIIKYDNLDIVTIPFCLWTNIVLKKKAKLKYVTAFYSPRDKQFKSTDYYFEMFEHIVSTGIDIVLYLDVIYKTRGDELLNKYKNLEIIYKSFETLKKDILEINIDTEDFQLPPIRNKDKDTVDYYYIQLSKLYHLSQYSSYSKNLDKKETHLCWIDFGIFYLFKNKDKAKYLLRSISNINLPIGCVFSPGAYEWNINKTYELFKNSFFDHIAWYFCGSLLIGDINMFDYLYEKQMNLVYQHIPKLTWEVNYWAMMYKDFIIYENTDHNESMLSEFINFITK